MTSQPNLQQQFIPSFSNSYFSLDSLLMGGGSLIVALVFWIFFEPGKDLMNVSIVAAALAFAVNHPHFLASYILLYGDHRARLFKEPMYFWAAVLAPAILLGLLVYGLYWDNAVLMGHIVNAMYFLVGWHYVKQVFGVIIVTSAQRRMYYSPIEKNLLKANLFSIWFLSWVGYHVGGTRAYAFYGINHYSIGLPNDALNLIYAALVITAIPVIYIHIKRYIEQGHIPSPPGVMSYLALLAWYLPTFSNAGFSYFIPLFHSLQYIALVWRFKANKTEAQSLKLEAKEKRKYWVKYFMGFVALSLLFGALAFEFIPKGLDKAQLLSSTSMGAQLFLAAFLLFINIHHYFIDNVIWRSKNDEIKHYLMH